MALFVILPNVPRALRSGGNFSTNDDMKTELQYSTNVHSERLNPPDAKPVLCAGLNEQTTTEIERLIWNILDKYKVNPMEQPNLTIEILKTCDSYLQRQKPCA